MSRYDWLIEVIDTTTMRPIGRVYTDRWQFYYIIRWPVDNKYIFRRLAP